MSDEQTTDQAPAEAQPELTLDDLFADQVNEEKVNETLKAMGLKSGTYTTMPEFKYKLGRSKDGKRRVINFFGQVFSGDVKGNIGYRISPDAANAHDQDGNDLGKPDSMTKLYALAVKAYGIAYGEKPTNAGQVAEYLRQYAHKVRVWQSDDGESRVVSISAIRPEQ